MKTCSWYYDIVYLSPRYLLIVFAFEGDSTTIRVVFTDNNAFYTYDDIQKKIIPFDELNKSLGYFSHAYRVCHFKADLYWFIRDGESALVQVKPGDIKVLDVVQYALFLNQTVDDYQNVITISEEECILTLENGRS